jgi:hypothetical protein
LGARRSACPSISATTSSIDHNRSAIPGAIAGMNAERLVDADEVVPEGIQRDHVRAVLQLLETETLPGLPLIDSFGAGL